MNYNHIFHAGNFADVLKHSILASLLSHFQTLHKPFFVLDTHSGRGRYNLSSPEALRSGEAQDGIFALANSKSNSIFSDDYLKLVKHFNPTNQIKIYPGSPAIIQKFLRKNDRAVFCELNEKEFFKLHALFHEDNRIKTIRGDGYEALLSCLPPKEKHGLVLIDPPFEKKDEIFTLEEAIAKSIRRWSNGTFMLWYPVKDYIMFEEHCHKLKTLTPHQIEIFTLSLPSYLLKTQTSLKETAVVVINPPKSLLDKRGEIEYLYQMMYPNESQISYA